jgi:hypothetical protein
MNAEIIEEAEANAKRQREKINQLAVMVDPVIRFLLDYLIKELDYGREVNDETLKAAVRKWLQSQAQ